jgi:hypothetical protein
MSDGQPTPAAAELEAFIGEWTMEVAFPGQEPMVGGSVRFDWMPGGWFLVQRWEVPVPEAPDGVAIIGWDTERGTLLQHYFDDRGVARVYEMTLDGGVWTLSRTAPDFSPLHFEQRYRGEFSQDGRTITGAWDIKEPGEDWKLDFPLTYRKVG